MRLLTLVLHWQTGRQNKALLPDVQSHTMLIVYLNLRNISWKDKPNKQLQLIKIFLTTLTRKQLQNFSLFAKNLS